jgi:hypothetical protein
MEMLTTPVLREKIEQIKNRRKNDGKKEIYIELPVMKKISGGLTCFAALKTLSDT